MRGLPADLLGAHTSHDTRARVREVAERLGYVPNRLAQGLRVQRSGTIGFVGDQVAPAAQRRTLSGGADPSWPWRQGPEGG